MKTLFEFVINKEQLVDKAEETTNETGEKITITKKVKEKVPHKFVIKQPNRSLRDSGSLFYGKMKSHAIEEGLMPAAVIENKYDDREKTNLLWKNLNDGVKKLQEMELIKEADRTEEQKESYKKQLAEVTQVSTEIQNKQNFRTNLSANTAEDYARQRSMEWWVMNLAYCTDGKSFSPFFGEGDFSAKSEKWNEMEENPNPFQDEVIDKFVALIQFYYLYPDLATKDKFEAVLKMWETEKESETKRKEESNEKETKEATEKV